MDKKSTRGGKREGAGRKSKTYNGIPKVRYSCFLRSDIYNTLKTVDNRHYFVECALLEKFNKDGMKLENS